MFYSSDDFLNANLCMPFFFHFVRKLTKSNSNFKLPNWNFWISGQFSSFSFLFRVCGLLLKIRSRNSFQPNYKNVSFLIFFIFLYRYNWLRHQNTFARTKINVMYADCRAVAQFRANVPLPKFCTMRWDYF